jgi:serine phosphatase RsbU (regulator of sigma subunit)
VTELFDAAGTLREAYRRVDWAATPLGPVSSWTPALTGAVDLLLHTRSPVTLMWGPELVLVYNEAYVQTIGDKHPGALGSPSRVVFAEIWDDIGPMLQSVLDGHGATWVEDMRLLMDRRGFLEETYFTFSYSAVRGPGGVIEGVIDIASETTRQVIGRRRLELLSRLTDRLGALDDPDMLAREALPLLREYPDDLPGIEMWPPGPHARRPGGELRLDGDGRWARMSLADDAELAVRLSPHLAPDDDYLDFLRLVGAALAQGLHRIRVRQADRRAVTMEREMSEVLQRSLLGSPVQADHLQVAVRYQPAAEGAHIGGDWYDTFLLPDGRLTVVVGDVTGHDRHAAAAMSQIRNLLRGIAYALPKRPARVLSALNDAMSGLAVDVFATAVLAQIELPSHELRWSNAGHVPPVLLDAAGDVHLLEAAPEVMLGTRLRGRRSDHVIRLQPGATVVFYTDGLVERRGSSLDAGLKELMETLRGCRHLSAEELCDHLLARFGAQTEDDVVLAVVRAGPQAAG